MKIPVAFSERMKARLGSEAESFFRSLQEEPVVSVRYNAGKMNRPETAEAVPWTAYGAFLEQRPVYALDPAWHAGCYYVQETSSMFLEQAVLQLSLQSQPLVALDLCASPGGKTTHLASLLHPGSLVVSNEAIQARLAPLRENVVKWGAGPVMITNNDPADFSSLREAFDLVVVDAPCSGEGLFRKDPASRMQWSDASCELCVSRQQRILRDILPAIRPGGTLIYSTCTWNEQENEEQLKWLTEEPGMEPIRLDVSRWPGIVEVQAGTGYGYAFLPHRIRGEGFFLAVLRKPGTPVVQKKKKGNKLFREQQVPGLETWYDTTGYKTFLRGEKILALPEQHVDAIETFFSQLNCRHVGLELAEMKGDKPVPQHGLAMSTLLNRKNFPWCELDLMEALGYLRKDPGPARGEKGWMLATYNGIVLGWLNNLGNRVNNYYPTEWRLRLR